MDKHTLLEKLPGYENKKVLINRKQRVGDIVAEILEAHKLFAKDYDKIALYFNDNSTAKICSRLYSFCKKEIAYKMESEDMQTTKSPAAILAQQMGDCKHYASFCGGILDAINRLYGKNIKWFYRFASYSLFNREPEHIFTVVLDNGNEIWIDPTPGAEKVTPVWTIDKKIKAAQMPLYRVSGIGSNDYAVSQLLDNSISEPAIYMAIQTLLKYGVMDVNGKINDKKLVQLQSRMSAADFSRLYEARQLLAQAAIGGFFSTIWRGVKKVTLSPLRNAFLGLVGINAFGYATKLSKAVWSETGDYTPFKEKLKTLWQDRFGGDWSALQNTIRKGATKKAILGGIGAAPAIPAWVATASAIIAAIMPLVNAFLKAKQQNTGIDYNIDPLTGMPYGGNTGTEIPTDTGGDIMSFIKENPVIVAGGLFLVYTLTKKNK
jgi:hypothetical protein